MSYRDIESGFTKTPEKKRKKVKRKETPGKRFNPDFLDNEHIEIYFDTLWQVYLVSDDVPVKHIESRCPFVGMHKMNRWLRQRKEDL